MKGDVAGKGGRRMNTVQKMCTHVCKCKNDNCRNYSRNEVRRRLRRAVEGVNSSMIHYVNATMCFHPAQQ
jgi:hypothetical protein